MADKKFTSIILLVATVRIWGMVAYKIASFSPQDNKTGDTDKHLQESSVAPMMDSLSLDYPDPFLKDLSLARMKHKDDKTHQDKAIPAPEPKPDFNFYGIISDGYETFAIILRNGEFHTFAKGDVIQGFRITEFSVDEMTLDFQGKRIKITRAQI